MLVEFSDIFVVKLREHFATFATCTASCTLVIFD